MDLTTNYTKTGRGSRAEPKKLPPNARQVLAVLSGKMSGEALFSQLPKMGDGDFEVAINWLVDGGYIKATANEAFQMSVWAPVTQSAFQINEISLDEFNQSSQPIQNQQNAQPPEQSPEQNARARAEEQVKAKLAKLAAQENADKARLQAEKEAEEEKALQAEQARIAAIARAEAAAKAKAEALARAQAEQRAQEQAGMAARLAEEKRQAELEKAALEQAAQKKAVAEAKAREEADLKAQLEAQLRLAAQQAADEAARKLSDEQAKEAQSLADAKRIAEEKAKLAELQAAEQKAAERLAMEAVNKRAAEALAAQALAQEEELARQLESARLAAELKAQEAAREEARLAAEQALLAQQNAAREKATLEAQASQQQALAAKLVSTQPTQIAENEQTDADLKNKLENLTKLSLNNTLPPKPSAATTADNIPVGMGHTKKRAMRQEKRKRYQEEILSKEAIRAQEEEADKIRIEAEMQAAAEQRAKDEADYQAMVEAGRQKQLDAMRAAKAQVRAERFAQIRSKLGGLITTAPRTFKLAGGAIFGVLGGLKLNKNPQPKKPPTKRALGNHSASAVSANLIRSVLVFIGKLLKYGLVLSLAAAVIAMIVLPFISLRMWQPAIEKTLSASLGHKVSVKSLHIAVLPKPHLVLNNVSSHAFNESNIGAVHLFAAPTDLKNLVYGQANTTQISQLTLNEISLAQSDVTKVARYLSQNNGENALNIQNITIQKLSIKPNFASPLVFEGEISMQNGVWVDAKLHTDDDKLRLLISNSAGYPIKLEAHDWQLPVKPQISFKQLTANGSLQADTVLLSEIEADIYSGTLKGKLTADVNTGHIEGDASIQSLHIADIAEELKFDSALLGDIDGSAKYTLNFKDENQLELTSLSASFKVLDGSIEKVDLTEAIRKGHLGGVTDFEQLTGSVQVANQQYQFRNLALKNGQLSASGAVNIGAQQQVGGEIYAKIALKNNVLQSRFQLTGNIDQLNMKK